MATSLTRKLLGDLPDLRDRPMEFMSELASTGQDLFRLHVPQVEIVMINHPDLIEEMLVKRQRDFIKPTLLKFASESLGNGLLTSDGDFWLRQRRLAAPAFHPRAIRGYAEIMSEVASRRTEDWQDGQTVEVHPKMMAITLEIVARSLFGSAVDEKTIREVDQIMEHLLRRFQAYTSLRYAWFDWLPWPSKLRFQRAVERLDEIVYAMIDEKEGELDLEHDDTLLALYLAARDEEGNRMNRRQLRDEVVTLFLAGHETTASALTFSIHLLSHDPERQERAIQEVESVLEGRDAKLDDVPQLEYVSQIATESMRLYPPAWRLGREAAVDTELGREKIEAGTQVVASHWAMHRDPRYFDDPDAFVPERWTEEFRRSIPKYAYFPFGGGPRLCIGARFAEVELVIVLATLLQRFRFEPVLPREVDLFPSITLRPDGPLPVVVRRRNAC